MLRFIHTGDWQLGMSRRFLSPEAGARYAQARFDAIRAIGRLAREHGCAFVAVAGDVFESNQVGPAVVGRALEAMADAGVPLVLLPGNHDPLNDASPYRTRLFAERRPANTIVLDGPDPVEMAPGVEVVGAPWRGKHLIGNPVLACLDRIGPAGGRLRVCLAHGPVDILPPFAESEAVIPVDRLERATAEGKIHFVALGDRHSLTRVGQSGRVWYAGTPEPTDFDEVDSGRVNLVEMDGGNVSTRPLAVGTWTFSQPGPFDLAGADDVSILAERLAGMRDKERTVVRLDLAGSLGLAEDADLRRRLEELSPLFAALDVRDENLRAAPAESDLAMGHLSGFAAAAAADLLRLAAGEGDAARTARDALLLLLRLAPPPEGGDA